MYQDYIPFGFDELYFESPPTPSFLGTTGVSATHLALTHRESFERYAHQGEFASAAGPSTVQQTTSPYQSYTPSTPNEYPPGAGDFHNTPGFYGGGTAMPPPNISQCQRTFVYTATRNQLNPIPSPNTPPYQLTTVNPSATLFAPGPLPLLNTVQYQPLAINPAATDSTPDPAYNTNQPVPNTFNHDQQSPAPTTERPDVVFGGPHTALPAKGLRWKGPIMPANLPPTQMAHVPTKRKPRPSSSKGKGKRKDRPHDSSAGEEGFDTGSPTVTTSQPEGTMTADWGFKNTFGGPAEKKKRVPVNQSVPIPKQYCYSCKKNLSRGDGLTRHLTRCQEGRVLNAAIQEADIVQGATDGKGSSNTSTPDVESNATALSAPATVKKNTKRRATGNPWKRKVSEQEGHLSGRAANPDPALPFPGFSTQVTAKNKAKLRAAANRKKRKVAEQSSEFTVTSNPANVSVIAQNQAAYALPISAMPHSHCGGAAYTTQMSYSHVSAMGQATEYSHPSYGPQVGSDRQQGYRSAADQSAYAGTAWAYTPPCHGEPEALSGMAAAPEPGSYDREHREKSSHQGHSSHEVSYISGADPSDPTAGTYYRLPMDAYPGSPTSQKIVSDAHYLLNYKYSGHIPDSHPQQTTLDVHEFQASFPSRQSDQYSTPGHHNVDFGHGEPVGHSFHSPAQEVTLDTRHHQIQLQSSDGLHDSTNTYATDTLVARFDPTFGQAEPPSTQQAREGRGIFSEFGSENIHPVNHRLIVPKLKRKTPSRRQLSTSLALVPVSSKPGQDSSRQGRALTVPPPVIASTNAFGIFSSPQKPTPPEATNDAASDNDGLFTDRGSSPLR